jgi:hypothetical protein
MILAGVVILAVVVIGSAKHIRPGEDGDSATARLGYGANNEPSPIAVATSPDLLVSMSVVPKSVEPVVRKGQRQENREGQKGSGEREAASEISKRAENEKAMREAASESPTAIVPPHPPAAARLEISLAEPAKLIVKRRRSLSEADLRKELRLAPEIPSLNLTAMNRLVSAQKVNVDFYKYIEHEPNILLKVRPDLKSLPVRKGRSCELDKRSASNLGVFSTKLHVLVDNPTPEESNSQHAMPGLLRKFMQVEVRGKRPEWLRPEAIPALQQILMQENKPLRWLLVEILAEIRGPAASVALAQRAIYDLSPEVRAIAVNALKDRPRTEYRQILLNGLRYPWAPAADHAAEALVALKDQEAVPILVAYLKEADPSEPTPSTKSQTLWREMVRINHAANCLMCHPPAARLSDPLAAPVPGLVLIGSVPRSTGHYGSIQTSIPTQSSFWVRVDITYLRQDFSIREPVKSPGTELVAYPRFDYLVRTRKVKTEEARELKTKSAKPQQREAVLFALRELTGKDAGAETDAWVKLYPPAKLDDETNRLKTTW